MAWSRSKTTYQLEVKRRAHERLYRKCLKELISVQTKTKRNHKKDLQGLPYYWRIPWPEIDTIILSCGHKRGVFVDMLPDENFWFPCPWCKGVQAPESET